MNELRFRSLLLFSKLKILSFFFVKKSVALCRFILLSIWGELIVPALFCGLIIINLMDFVIGSPNPNAVMGSQSVEMDSSSPQNDTAGSSTGSGIEDPAHAPSVASVEEGKGPVPVAPGSTPSNPGKGVVAGSGGTGEGTPQAPAPVPPQLPATGLQIVTRRKRSSLTAAAVAAGSSVPNSGNMNGVTPLPNLQPVAAPVSTTNQPEATAQPPPKKKKKYVPKPKKPAEEAKPKLETKPKAAPKPKTTKKPPAKKSQSKSKKGQQQPQAPATAVENVVAPESAVAGGLEENAEADVKVKVEAAEPVVPMAVPLPIIMPIPIMPKLTKMPIPILPPPSLSSPPLLPPQIRIKEEPQDWEDQDALTEFGDPLPIAGDVSEEPQVGEKPVTTSSRKKKSKGRNGNIYIGVFNRIEWMKLQGEFGFQTVNNFGTFVLQTMRRVYGDIQFWCDVAVASGVYPDLSHYEWVNGFPHAVNKDGHHFTPDALEISDERSAELGEMARKMWDERLELLKQQQEEQQQEVSPEVVTVPDEVDEVEEEDGDDPGLENYLENMANGQYFPSGITNEGGEGQSSASTAIQAEQVNKIWSEQASNPQNLEIFGNLFSFVNGIQSIPQGEVLEQMEQETTEDKQVVGGIGPNNLELDGSGQFQLPNVTVEEAGEVLGKEEGPVIPVSSE